ncbi:MAG: hypothetical protein M3Y71_12555 [Actinomycetota bacterium]|nr:hypothetical protein [Actinomycetota bacterium]
MSPRPTAPTRSAQAAVAAAGLLLTGCSGAAQGADSPQAAVTTFFHALGAKDSSGACAVISTQGRALEGVPLQECELGFDKVLAGLDDQQDITALSKAQVTGAQVSGGRATVRKAQITQVPNDFQSDIDLVRLGDRWYIDSKSDKTDPAARSDQTG